MSWRDSVKHAFAVQSPEQSAEPTPEQREVIDRWCATLVHKRLYSPMFRLVGQELAQPLNYVASQTMAFLRPSVRSIASDRFVDDYTHLAGFLEQRGSTDYIAERLAAMEADRDRRRGVASPADPTPETGPSQPGSPADPT